ncbi:MAG: hypothetical protein BWK80_48015 [Desulfobacteraceae bacterium IS3]|nr:MAG: hypothetical protein BWK80_48015 [Desulfobacteraceae bacterium IS3]HAO22176.1 hypothetical protein [Desulfobacteraceae bacterium]
MQKTPEQLAKFLSYILGRNPDEFGLIPDSNGYVRIKDLLKAFSEEEGLRYVREAHLKEVVLAIPNSPIELNESLIRAKNREHLREKMPAQDIPKLLYVCVRKKAHSTVLEKGLLPGAYPQAVLSSNPEMAQRIGRRIDQEPVMLTVHSRKLIEKGMVIYQTGETLYAADMIPADCITGPPLPKQKEESKKKSPAEERKIPVSAGSFFPDFTDNEKKKEFLKDKRKREAERDKDKRKSRKQKQKGWE